MVDEAVAKKCRIMTVIGDNQTPTAGRSLSFAIDGWRVVTIVDMVIGPDSDAEKHAIARFSSVLLPGQSQLISVPLALGEQQQVLRISRIGDRIQVVRIPGV